MVKNALEKVGLGRVWALGLERLGSGFKKSNRVEFGKVKVGLGSGLGRSGLVMVLVCKRQIGSDTGLRNVIGSGMGTKKHTRYHL